MPRNLRLVGDVDPDDELVSQIEATLREEGLYLSDIGPGASARVEHVRRLARRAGRSMGWRITTTVTGGPAGGWTVHVIVVSASTPEENERLAARRLQRLRAAMNKMS